MNSPAPRRILMTADTIGGVWSYALELCGAWQALEVEILLATMGAPLTRDQSAQVARFSHVQVFESRYKLEWMDSPWRDVAAAGEWLLGLNERFCPDLIHLNGYAHAALPWRSPKLVVGHSCVLSWWKAVKGGEAPEQWNTYRGAVKGGLQSADLVVAPSVAMLDCLQAHYGPLPRTCVIPNGRGLCSGIFRRKEELVLSAGRLWDEAKNISTLTSIANSLPWPVCIAGEEQNPFQEGKAGTRQFASHASVTSPTHRVQGRTIPNRRLHYLGRLAPQELASWFARASIYAAPARYEPFGLSILEAALAGCALVLGDIPSLREIWGDTAIYVCPENGPELRHTIEQLIFDAQKREALARRAHCRAAEFTPERMAAGYWQAYGELLQAGSAPVEQEEAACAS